MKAQEHNQIQKKHQNNNLATIFITPLKSIFKNSFVAKTIVLVIVLMLVRNYLPNSLLPDFFPTHQTSIVNVILNERRGIQELACAQSNYTIEKNLEEKKDLWVTNYVTKKFLCDYYFTVKYGYDLSELNRNNISEDTVNKIITINLPKGKILSNELTQAMVRHNEGIAGDWNKVSADEAETYRQAAKKEASTKALEDPSLKFLAQENIQKAISNLVQSKAPGYQVKVVEK